jgi:hypothetical protein
VNITTNPLLSDRSLVIIPNTLPRFQDKISSRRKLQWYRVR